MAIIKIQEGNRKNMFEFLKTENDYITYLLEAFEVPETVEGEQIETHFILFICDLIHFILEDSDEDEYLLEAPKKKMKLITNGDSVPAETVEELQERAEIVKKKFEQRKATKKSLSHRKKDKKDKVLKKQQIQNRRKTMTNEILKHERVKKPEVKDDPDKDDQSKKSNVYNKEGKLFFSKVQIDGEKKKKVHDTNPQANLAKLKAQKRKIQDLVESGDKLKAKEEKEKILWKAAFEKSDGLKVKDNVDVLKKTIKKRKVEKKKSKSQWGERKQKVEEKQAAKSKKREDNLKKRITDNQKTKKKNAIKKGRVKID